MWQKWCFLSQAWWHTPVVPATEEAEGGGLLGANLNQLNKKSFVSKKKKKKGLLASATPT
jgi:hypothetical protein